MSRRIGGVRIKRFRRMILAGRPWVECHYCGLRLTDSDLTLDHVIPLSKGGGGGMCNIVPACQCCNRKRGNLDYRKFVARCAA